MSIIHTIAGSVLCGLQLRQLPPGHIAVTPYNSSYHTAAQESAQQQSLQGLQSCAQHARQQQLMLPSGRPSSRAGSSAQRWRGQQRRSAQHDNTRTCKHLSDVSVAETSSSSLHLVAAGVNHRVHHHPVPTLAGARRANYQKMPVLPGAAAEHCFLARLSCCGMLPTDLAPTHCLG